jgi:uncharacterized membrane protein
MTLQQREKHEKSDTHAPWYIILYKLTFGLIEFASGVGIRLFGKQIVRLYTLNLSKELSEDPHDMLARISAHIAPQIFTHNSYLVLYLILLGGVKIAGAIGLIYRQNWGVDLLVGLTILMFPFQLTNLFVHHSLFDFLYLSTGLLIALYLIEFKPKAWISRILLHLREAEKKQKN